MGTCGLRNEPVGLALGGQRQARRRGSRTTPSLFRLSRTSRAASRGSWSGSTRRRACRCPPRARPTGSLRRPQVSATWATCTSGGCHGSEAPVPQPERHRPGLCILYNDISDSFSRRFIEFLTGASSASSPAQSPARSPAPPPRRPTAEPLRRPLRPLVEGLLGGLAAGDAAPGSKGEGADGGTDNEEDVDPGVEVGELHPPR